MNRQTSELKLFNQRPRPLLNFYKHPNLLQDIFASGTVIKIVQDTQDIIPRNFLHY